MRNSLRIILAIIILITGIYTIIGYNQEQDEYAAYEDVDQYIKLPDVPDFTLPDSDAVVELPTPSDDENFINNIASYQVDYDWDGLLSVNKEIAGWLYIPGDTNINFPIPQGKDNTYYLTRDYKRQWSGNGSAFIDYKYNKLSLSKVIYGHNMSLSQTKPIFTKLMWWKDEEYFYNNRTLYYTDVNGMTKKYLIVAIAGFNVYKEKEYSYLDTFFETEEEFRGWVEYIKEHSIYFDLGDNTIDYRADEVIVLSTCDREFGRQNGTTQGRCILFCVNLTNNELNGELN